MLEVAGPVERVDGAVMRLLLGEVVLRQRLAASDATRGPAGGPGAVIAETGTVPVDLHARVAAIKRKLAHANPPFPARPLR